LKREIINILSSYVGWYDPFCELIQNALDSVEENMKSNKDSDNNYQPKISILINLKKNSLTVTDNGVGLDERKFKQFLAPCFSFKSGGITRGHKGVGATYLAYGFNSIQICTKTDDYSAIGKMTGARDWLDDQAPSGNPVIKPDATGCIDPSFSENETGVSITVTFDAKTHPKDLSWIKADTAKQWKVILLVKTGLGAFFRNNDVDVKISVVDKESGTTIETFKGAEYFWPDSIINKSIKLRDLTDESKKVYDKGGLNPKIPSKLKNIECIYDTLDREELLALLNLDEKEQESIEKLDPVLYFSYMSTAKVWPTFNESLNLRKGQSILIPGVQICANNMPQGDVIQVPLNRNIGRQNQISVVVHFNNCNPDMGRKGFQSEVVELSKSISRKIIENVIQSKFKDFLKSNSGASPDLRREHRVSEWKKEFEKHEIDCPLNLISEHFFKPTNKISITSVPTREQDVIALFNQLIAGGVIRGVNIMSTNERFIYDGMYRVSFKPPLENHVFDEGKNPLGVIDDHVKEMDDFKSEPKILEYKFSLDGLIENIEDGS
ncbi:TPA: ATP-binding protein, partial [Yersinia enterocolitica]|nr:ATP-binding protein [Yersinia enterocolitica]